MKKFLSLLLTLTMVLSLAVVPARADTPEGGSSSEPSTPAAPTATLTISGPTTAKEDDTVSYHATASVSYDGHSYTISDDKFTSWTWGGLNGVDNNKPTYSGIAGSVDLIITCSASFTFDKPAPTDEDPNHTESVSMNATAASVSVDVTSKAEEANAEFKAAVAGLIQYAGRSTSLSGNKITAYKYSSDATAWTVAENIGTTYTSIAFDPTPATTGTGTMTVKGTKAGEPTIPVTATFDFEVKTPTFSIKRTPADGNIIAGGKIALATDTSDRNFALPNGLSYEWKYAKADGSADPAKYVSITNTGSSFDWTVPSTLAGDYVVKCTAKSSDTVVATATNTLTITVIADNWALYPTTLNTINLAVGQSAPLPTVELYSKVDGKQGTKVADLRYDWTSNSARIFVDTATGKVTALSGASGDYKLTVSTTYQGKTYSKEVTVRVSSLSAKLSSGVQNGGYVDLTYAYSNSYTSLAYLAQTAIRNQISGKSSVTVSSASLATIPGTTRGSLNTYGSYYRYSAPKSYFGNDTLTITARASDGNTYYVTLTIPVTPILNTSFESVNAELVSTTSSTYGSYRVYFPTSHAKFYVLNTTGTAPSDWTSVSLGGTSYSSSTPYTLNVNSSNYNNGQVTLYVVAQRYASGSYSEYYAGPLTVYLQSNDIEYTGVAGSTVNFQHSSFTSFLNSMNTSSNTYYYEFQDVTFTYFNSTTQGTLYYGSTAMTSGSYSSSSYFNSATKVTNLDNVSFAIKSTIPASVKTISIPFQLHAKQYRSGSYSSSFVSDVTFSGRVVISVAREDIVINVAAGDAVKLDATAFLNYLRNSSTSYRNANIDYVTFSQNLSVSSSNSAYTNGALYTYYTNSYSFGNPVTSTDRFYYSTTTYNVNRLSDVAFRANTYATAGTTVYIPFTIKLLNSNATVTGTLAAKIANAVNFYDVTPGAYYYDAVKWAVGAGVTKGTGNNMFSPAKSCTRAEIVTFLWRAAGTPAPKRSTNPFTDVYSGMGSDFYNAILWAVGEGITTGTTTSKFSPNDTCTRGQIVTFLHRYLKTPSGYYSNPFKDIKSGYYCYNAVIWAYGSGVAKGTSATTFSPDATCTRGDAVTFLYRALVK